MAESERRAVYTHGDGHQEEVEIRKYHPEAEAYTVFVPSLNRERQTTSTRLKIMYVPAVFHAPHLKSPH